MATLMKLFFAFAISVILLSKGVSSTTTEPTISASPGVLPYVSAPDISSFFPTPSGYQPLSYDTSSEPPAPAPSSGEFQGKISSASASFHSPALILSVLLSFAVMSSTMLIV